MKPFFVNFDGNFALAIEISQIIFQIRIQRFKNWLYPCPDGSNLVFYLSMKTPIGPFFENQHVCTNGIYFLLFTIV